MSIAWRELNSIEEVVDAMRAWAILQMTPPQFDAYVEAEQLYKEKKVAS